MTGRCRRTPKKVRLGAALMGVEIARGGGDVFPGRGTATRFHRAMKPMGTVTILADHRVTLTTAEGALVRLARDAAALGGGPEALATPEARLARLLRGAGREDIRAVNTDRVRRVPSPV